MIMMKTTLLRALLMLACLAVTPSILAQSPEKEEPCLYGIKTPGVCHESPSALSWAPSPFQQDNEIKSAVDPVEERDICFCGFADESGTCLSSCEELKWSWDEEAEPSEDLSSFPDEYEICSLGFEEPSVCRAR